MARPKSKTKTKQCPKCEKTKSRKYFYSTSAYCKKCQRIAVIDNQKEKADYYSAYRNEYAKNNPDKKNAWKKTAIERWEKKHSMKYSDFIRLRHHIRLSIDPEYRGKIAEQNRKRYQTRSESYKKYKQEYNIANRELLRLKSKERYYRNRLMLAKDDSTINQYQKQVKDVQQKIKTINSTRKKK